MKNIYAISNATVIDGILDSNRMIIMETYEDAIAVAQNSIAEDFGFDDWDEYLSENDPEITEEDGMYVIHDSCCCGHEECYMIIEYELS